MIIFHDKALKNVMNKKTCRPLRGKTAALAIIICLSLSAFSAPSAVAHDNKVDYVSVGTGNDLAAFRAGYPDFAEKYSGGFMELEKRASRDKTIFGFRRPKDKKYFESVVRQITARAYGSAAPEKCESPSEAVSLSFGRDKNAVGALYAYSFLVCADDRSVTPARMLDKYVEKYGPYDARDWDRDERVYYNVRERYRVMVRPLKTASGNAGLMITVVDDGVFDRTYVEARARIRNGENAAMGKF